MIGDDLSYCSILRAGSASKQVTIASAVKIVGRMPLAPFHEHIYINEECPLLDYAGVLVGNRRPWLTALDLFLVLYAYEIESFLPSLPYVVP